MQRPQSAEERGVAEVAQDIAGLRGLHLAVVFGADSPPPAPPAHEPATGAQSPLSGGRPALFCRCERQLSRTPANPDWLFYSCSSRTFRSNTFVWAEQRQ